MAWEASSITVKPYRCASAAISDISHDCPAKCTGITTLGRFPVRSAASSLFRRLATLKLLVLGSMSTKSTPAPQYRPQLAEATKVLGEVQSKPSLPSPAARQAMWRADVALFTATAYLAPQYSATPLSNFSMAGPYVSQSELRTATTASMSSCEIVWRP